MSWFKNILSIFAPSQGDQEYDSFIRLIQVGCRDREIKSRLLHLLKAKPIDRPRLIKNMCLILEKEGGDTDLVNAIRLLQDEHLALCTRDILEKKWG